MATRRAPRHRPARLRHFAYFDQNVFDTLLDGGHAPETVVAAMDRRGYELVLSEHHIQEWAACWKSGDPAKIARGQRLMVYAMALRLARLVPPVPALLRYEVAPLIGPRIPGPFLSESDAIANLAMLHRMASSGLTGSDDANMRRVWNRKESEAAAAARLRDMAQARGLNARTATFEEFVQKNRHAVIVIGTGILQRALATLSARERAQATQLALRRLPKCPALRASIRANLFINRCILDSRSLRHDRWDDLKHAILATPCDVFVTGDAGLRAALTDVRPGPVVRATADFRHELGL